MNTYESIFILKPTLSDEDVQKTVNKLEGIVKQSGELISAENWGKKKLAYEVMKEKKGIYVLLRFLGKGELVLELEKNYRFDDSVIKFLTVKLDKKGVELLKKRETAILPILPPKSEVPKEGGSENTQ
ncbi:MAG: 30S ribosomal protein S6 [Nitrospirae bacterium RIFCSPLOW2_12_42_9]|nr:MAG: 30S ribosomal protein S6 [Nitrospirae bacterium RIFCSPLOW2_12_42_9]